MVKLKTVMIVVGSFMWTRILICSTFKTVDNLTIYECVDITIWMKLIISSVQPPPPFPPPHFLLSTANMQFSARVRLIDLFNYVFIAYMYSVYIIYNACVSYSLC